MKKMFNYIIEIVFLFSLLFMVGSKVNAADKVSFTCNYSFNAGGSENVEIKIITKDLKYDDIKKLKSYDKADDKFKKLTEIQYRDKKGNWQTLSNNALVSSVISNYKGNNGNMMSLFYFTGGDTNANIKEFLINATNSASANHQAIKCPDIYYGNFDKDGYGQTLLFVSSIKNIQTNAWDGQIVYNTGKPVSSMTTTEFNVDDLYDSSEIICTYSSNSPITNSKYELHYYKDAPSKKLLYTSLDGMKYKGQDGVATISGDMTKNVDLSGNTYLMDLFKNNKCPKKIKCDCISITGCKIYTGSGDFDDSEACGNLLVDNGEKIQGDEGGNGGTPDAPDIPDGGLSSCSEILGSNLTKVVKAGITIIQIAGAIIALVKGMMTLIPPILAKDADALKKAGKTLVTMAIILVAIFLFRPLLRFIGNVAGFDASCF